MAELVVSWLAVLYVCGLNPGSMISSCGIDKILHPSEYYSKA
jgi:hypothetical protein